MILNNRIIFSNNNVLQDLSVNLNNFRSGVEALTIIAAEDKIYFGSILPFNHKWIEMGAVANAAAAVISDIEVWDGDEWQSVVDIIDQTKIGTSTFAQSGYISWVPDKDESWLRDDTRGTDTNIDPIEGLGDASNPVTIYDMYWARFTFSADLTAAMELKFVGHKFSAEEDLGDQYPELILSTTKAQFETGKTDWKNQEFMAAERIIEDLERDEVVKTRDNILNWERFTMASVHKIAEIIYKAFGDDYEDNRKVARSYYLQTLKAGRKEIDRNRNARKDPQEAIDSQGTLIR